MAYTSDFINGISAQLHKISDFPIYVDFKKQKAKFPCWYVQNEDVSHQQKLGNRYFRDGKYTVSLFLSENGEIVDVRALHDLAEKLFWALEYIDVNDSKIRGYGMSYEIVDDVLVFTIKYKHFIERIEHADSMQSLDINERVKDNGE